MGRNLGMWLVMVRGEEEKAAKAARIVRIPSFSYRYVYVYGALNQAFWFSSG